MPSSEGALTSCMNLSTMKEWGKGKRSSWWCLLDWNVEHGFQLSNRKKQLDWITAAKGPFNPSFEGASLVEWAQAAYADFAAVAPFALQSAAELQASRTGMFVAVVFASTCSKILQVLELEFC